MKRCPKCNHAESDDSLAYCRADGTRLVSEGAGTLRFDSAPVTGETETRMLPTGEGVSRPTAPTTVLDGGRASGNTQELSKPKSRKGLLIAAAAITAVTVAASAYFYLSRAKTGAAKNSIAVLPFQNASSDPEVEYLSDGISESLINSLSQLPNVRVLARSTMFSFKGKELNPQEVGRQLGVETVLTGRVVQRGDGLTIQADLVNVADGSQLWGERYNRKAADVLAVQEDIAREIVNKLRLRLSGEQQERVTKRHTESAEAYEHYLRGRYFWNKRTEEGLQKAVEYFERAIETDPNYALAYSGLADSYVFARSASAPREGAQKAKAAARKALDIDGGLAEAHASLGQALFYGLDWGNAEREFQRAIELNPNYATAHQWYAVYLMAVGRSEEAFAEINRARELDPLSLIIADNYGWLLYFARRYDESIELFRKNLEAEPDFPRSRSKLINAYERKAMYEEAIKLFTEKEFAEETRQVFRKSGARGYWQSLLERRRQLVGSGANAAAIALPYAELGEKDKAFEWLQSEYEAGGREMLFLKVDPKWDSLRSDPRFAELTRKVGLPR